MRDPNGSNSAVPGTAGHVIVRLRTRPFILGGVDDE